MATNIAVKLQLQNPTNPTAQQMAQQIQGQLGSATVNIQLKLNPNVQTSITTLNASINQLNASTQQLINTSGSLGSVSQQTASQLQQLNNPLQQLNSGARQTSVVLKDLSTSFKSASETAYAFGEQAGLATRRFLAFSIGAGTILGSLYAFKQGINDAITFQGEMVRLAQVSSTTATEIKSISNEIGSLAQSYGTSSLELARASVSIRQAGVSAKDTASVLQTLAQAALAPNFGTMEENVQGAISAMSQFHIKADQLNQTFSSINAVSTQFAVSAKDIQDGVLKTGSAFSSAGGNINEFIALFTSVKATTQESAETIGAGLRNIFTRLQTRETLNALQAMRIELRYTAQEAQALGNINLTNQFVGPYEAIQRIGQALRGLPATDQRFLDITQAIGSTRNISRALPLIQQNDIQQRALDVAQNAGGSLGASATQGLDKLNQQGKQVSETFEQFYRLVTQSTGFQRLASDLLSVAGTFGEILKVVAPLIPLFITLSSLQVAKGATSFASGFINRIGQPSLTASPTRYAGGGYTHAGPSLLSPGEAVLPPNRYASGGFTVPGVGNQDSELYNLPAGSFVVRKDSAQKIGRGALLRFAEGGLSLPVQSYSSKELNSLIKHIDSGTVNQSNDLYSSFLLNNIKKTGAYEFLPKGSKFIGNGIAAAAFREPDYGDVFRIQPYIGERPLHRSRLTSNQRGNSDIVARAKGINSILEPYSKDVFSYNRPNIESVVQNLGSTLFDSAGHNTLIEKLPYLAQTPPTDALGNIPEEIFDNLRYRLGASGYMSNDLHSDNIRYQDSRYKLLDVGGLKDIHFTEKKYFQEKLNEQLKIADKPTTPFKLAAGGIFGSIGSFFSGIFGKKPQAAPLADTVKELVAQLPKQEVVPDLGIQNINPVEEQEFFTNSYVQNVRRAKQILSEIGIAKEKPLFDIDLSANSELRNLGVKNPNQLGIHLDQIDAYLGHAGRFAKKAGLEDASTSIFQKLGETATLRQSVADFHDIPFADPQVLPEGFGKKGQKANILQYMSKMLNVGAERDDVQKEASKIFGIASSTSNKYFLQARKLHQSTNPEELGFSSTLEDFSKFVNGTEPKKFAHGGSPEDTQLAALTPGEFVFSRNATSRIGIANLDRANKTGDISHMTGGQIKGYNRGGVVGYALGGDVEGSYELEAIEEQKRKRKRGGYPLGSFSSIEDSPTRQLRNFLISDTNDIREEERQEDIRRFRQEEAARAARRIRNRKYKQPLGPPTELYGNAQLSPIVPESISSLHFGDINPEPTFSSSQILEDTPVLSADTALNVLRNSPHAKGTKGSGQLLRDVVKSLSGTHSKEEIRKLLQGEDVSKRYSQQVVKNVLGGSSDEVYGPETPLPGYNVGGLPSGTPYVGRPTGNTGTYNISPITGQPQTPNAPNTGATFGIHGYNQPIGPNIPPGSIYPLTSSFINSQRNQVYGPNQPSGTYPPSFNQIGGAVFDKVTSKQPELEKFIGLTIDAEHQNLSAVEKQAEINRRIVSLKENALQTEINAKQITQNEAEIRHRKFLGFVGPVQHPNDPEAISGLDNAAKVLNLEQANNKLRQHTLALDKSLETTSYTPGRLGRFFGHEEGLATLGGKGTGSGFFSNLFGGGASSEIRQARIQGLATAGLLAANFAGDKLSEFAGTPDEAIRNDTRGSYVTGKALSSAGTYTAIGATLGSFLAPGPGTLIGAGVGAAYGGISGGHAASQELDLSKFRIEIERATTSFTSLVNSVDRLGGKLSEAQIAETGVFTQQRIASAEGSFQRSRNGFFSRAGLGISSAYNYVTGGEEGAVRSVSDGARRERNLFPDYAVQTDPSLASAINRRVEGTIYNTLINNRDASQDTIRRNIGRATTASEREIFARGRGFGPERGGYDNYIVSQEFRAQQLAISRPLALSGVQDRAGNLPYGLSRFVGEIQDVGNALEIFAHRINDITNAVLGGTNISKVSISQGVLGNPVSGPIYDNLVRQVTGGLPQYARDQFSTTALHVGRLGQAGPSALQAYLRDTGLEGELEVNAPNRRGRQLSTLLNESTGVTDSRSSQGLINEDIARRATAISAEQRARFNANPIEAESHFNQILAQYQKPLLELAKAQENIQNQIINAYNQILQITLRRIDYLGKAADTESELAKITAQQTSIQRFGTADNTHANFSYAQSVQGFNTRINGLGGSNFNQNTSIGEIQRQAEVALAGRNRLNEEADNGRTRTPEFLRQLDGFNQGLVRSRQALELYATSTQRTTYLQEELQANQAERNSRLGGQRRFILGSDEDRAGLVHGAALDRFVQGQGDLGAQRAAFNNLGLPGQQTLLHYNETFADVRDTQGRTGRDRSNYYISGQIPELNPLNEQQNALIGKLSEIYTQMSTASAALAELAGKGANTIRDELVRQNNNSLNELTRATQELVRIQEAGALGRNGLSILDASRQNFGTEGTNQALDVLKTFGYSAGDLNQRSSRYDIANTVIPNAELFGQGNSRTSNILSSLLRQFEEVTDAPRFGTIPIDINGRVGPSGLAGGGIVYANQGFFQPRGSDTVPAMLTPGEMVINQASTSANRGLLEIVNNARGPVYRADGGLTGNDLEEHLLRITGQSHLIPHIRNERINRDFREALERANTLPETTETYDVDRNYRRIDNTEYQLIGGENQRDSRFRNQFSNISSTFAFSPIGIQEQLNRGATGESAAITYQQQASQNLLRQQILNQTRTSGDFGGIFSGGELASSQRQGQAGILGELARRNRGYLTQQPFADQNQQLLRYLRPQRRATGGMINGPEGGDVIPAFLSNGEYVMDRRTTAAIGPQNLAQMQRFANGGLVGSGVSGSTGTQDTQLQQALSNFAQESTILTAALRDFSNNNTELVDALKAFPHTISLEGTHKVEVLLNGGEVLASLEPEFKELVITETKKAIQNLLKDKFPEA